MSSEGKIVTMGLRNRQDKIELHFKSYPESGRANTQVLVMFIIMPGRKKAARRVFNVHIRGCSYHHNILQRIQRSSLSNRYTNDNIRHVFCRN